MTVDWHFKPHPPGITVREPIANAFFASDAVSEPGAALVREGIQNSLDATPDGALTFVRISLIDEGGAFVRGEVNPYLANASSHYNTDGCGLRKEDIPTEDDAASALIFEDFNTNGLQGDPATPYPPKDKGENNFFHFFRAEGLTDKDSSKRGSWGLGKDTFFRASRLNTIFGLTVRKDDGRRLLMGKVILRSHHIDNDLYQDGYYGVVPGPDQQMVMPVEDNAEIDRFIETFNLERQKDNSGLSVIVPWPHHEITESALIKAVFSHYFYAILSGDLQVIVETSGIETLLDSDSLLSEAQKLTDDQGILKLIELAQWAVRDGVDGGHTIGMPDPQRAWAWGREMFPDDTLRALSEELQNGERAAVRVPVTVRKKDGTHTQSFFDVYLTSDDSNERKRPVFIRDGIMVADVRAPSMRGVRAMIVVNDPPLSEFLRKAENPSHTVWHGHQLKDDYVSGVTDLRFVVDSVRSIYDSLVTRAFRVGSAA